MKDSSATISGKRRPPVADREGELVLVRGARFTPALLLVATTWLGVGSSAWSFLAIPFLAIGWIGATIAVLSVGYAILIAGALLMVPRESLALVPLLVGLLIGAFFLVRCVYAAAEGKRPAGDPVCTPLSG